MAFGNRQWLRVHHTKPSTVYSDWFVQTNDTSHFQKPLTTIQCAGGMLVTSLDITLLN